MGKKSVIFAVVIAILAMVILGFAAYTGSLRTAAVKYHGSLPGTIAVESGTFTAEGAVPPDYTCEGRGASPHIAWRNVPAGTKSLALIATDWDVPSPDFRLAHFAHWVMYNIPAGKRELPAGASEESLEKLGITVGENSTGKPGYTPPCPPLGVHKYEFRVYALDVAKIEPKEKTRSAVMEAMAGHILAFGELTAVYGR
jgi:Raf kinase inhibitor-like YbhB/YbcL family protein